MLNIIVYLLFDFNFFFFFFQAEDGIRDLTVTGVQTCALPISGVTVSATTRDAVRATTYAKPSGRSKRPSTLPSMNSGRKTRATITVANTTDARSEERRVGKEGRSRWAPCHEKER